MGVSDWKKKLTSGFPWVLWSKIHKLGAQNNYVSPHTFWKWEVQALCVGSILSLWDRVLLCFLQTPWLVEASFQSLLPFPQGHLPFYSVSKFFLFLFLFFMSAGILSAYDCVLHACSDKETRRGPHIPAGMDYRWMLWNDRELKMLVNYVMFLWLFWVYIFSSNEDFPPGKWLRQYITTFPASGGLW